MGMITQETTHTELLELLEQVKADAERFNKNFGRPRLKLIQGGKLTQQEELRIMAFMAEWQGLQELKRLRGDK